MTVYYCSHCPFHLNPIGPIECINLALLLKVCLFSVKIGIEYQSPNGFRHLWEFCETYVREKDFYLG